MSIAMGTRLHINIYKNDIYITTSVPILVILSQNAQSDVNMIIIYIIIIHCSEVGAFPRPFCVPNSVALASLTLQVGDWAIH